MSIFAETPAELLAEVAAILEEVDVKAGETILHKEDVWTDGYGTIVQAPRALSVYYADACVHESTRDRHVSITWLLPQHLPTS